VTTERTVVIPEGEPGPEPIPDQIKVYGSGRSRPRSRRRFPTALVAGTAALAFAIGAAVLTVPELIAGQSIGGGNRGTTIFGGKKKQNREQAPTQTTPAQTQQQTTPTQTQTQPQSTSTQPAPSGQQQR
jgi:hypothetical protein